MNKDKVFAIFFVVLTLVLCNMIWQVHDLKQQIQKTESRQNELTSTVSLREAEGFVNLIFAAGPDAKRQVRSN